MVIKYYVVKIRTLICGFKIDKSYAVNEARSCLRWLAEKVIVVVGCQHFDSDLQVKVKDSNESTENGCALIETHLYTFKRILKL
jgi:hypothetical protein